MKYRMPAEWEPHEATFIAWPHFVDHWPGKFDPIPHVYVKIVKALIEGGEKVFICVNNKKMETEARELLIGGLNGKKDLERIRFFQIPTNASWSRDHGPIFVRDDKSGLVIEHWTFNAWGNQWPHNKDELVPQKIAEQLKIPIIKPNMILEGGSIDVNGNGLLLTTTSCLLNQNRNSKFTRQKIEQHLREYLGIEKILWLEAEIKGDDTSGHIDDIARFTGADTIVCMVEENEDDENYNVLNKCFEELKRMTDRNGKPLKIVPVLMPQPVIFENQRLPASYANFYIANKAVLVPTFNCKNDKKALDAFAGLFPARKITGIDCVDLVWGFGAIHCSTQQMPAKIL